MSVAPPLVGALPPTVQDIKAWSRLDFAELDEPFSDADLRIRLDRAVAYLEAMTGRTFDATMPPYLVPIAQEAVQLRVEQMAWQEQPDYQETANDDQIQSFSAGGYSETRRVIRTYAGAEHGLPEMNPNAWLNRDIWLLCTEAMRTYWVETLMGAAMAAQIPSFAVTEADWGNYGGLYPSGFRTAMSDLPGWGLGWGW